MDGKTLKIRFKIPFIGDQDTKSKEYMIFHKWLPLDEKDYLTIDLEFGQTSIFGLI